MPKHKKSRNRPQGTDQLLQLLQRSGKPLRLKTILGSLASRKRHRNQLLNRIEELVASGKLASLNKGRSFILVDKLKQIRGTLEIAASGAGFLLPENKDQDDVYISQANLNSAWPGDTVIAAILPEKRGKNPEGRIIRIVNRKMSDVHVVLTKQTGPDTFWGQAVDPSLNLLFVIDVSPLKARPGPGEVLIIEQLQQEDGGVFSARAREVLGEEKNALVQERIVKRNKEIPGEFPEQVIEAARALPANPEEEEIDERWDLRALGFVTIDGEEARDFDDAIFVSREDTTFRLIVAIADVSHYVRPGTALDREAFQRGNSYYFPCSVEPMFPQRLSNELCSLLPDRDRLVMAVQLGLSPSGERIESSFYPAVIRSRARLTYTQIQKGVLQEDAAVQRDMREQLPMLRQAEQLARILKRVRQRRGALDFDLPEPEIRIDAQNHPAGIRKKEHHFGHQIVEEFMLAANEAVADWMSRQEIPALYRIHPDPDAEKLSGLFNLLACSDLQAIVPRGVDPASLQELLADVAGTGQDFLINRLLLRTMMQAAYSVENQGHFGLAATHYCHFTSPIRRYADLTVHRCLKTALGLSKGKSKSRRTLEKIALHLNTQERRAVEAEREIQKRLTIVYLQDKTGELFDGVVSGVAEYGIWVELSQVLAEGFVRLDTLGNDSYVLIQEEHRLRGQRTGKSYRLGDRIRVRLSSVSLLRLEIDLEIET